MFFIRHSSIEKPFILIISLFTFLLEMHSQVDTSLQKTDTNKIIIYDTIRYEKIIYEYDTTWVVDTAKSHLTKSDTSLKESSHDTTMSPREEILNQTSRKKMQNFEFHARFGYYFPTRYHFYSPDELKEWRNLINNSTSLKEALDIRLDFSYKRKKLNAKLGAELFFMKEKVFFPEENEIIFNNYYDITQSGYWQTDTVESYFQYINNDTTWIYITKDKYIESTDSVLITEIDTNITRDLYTGINKIVYFNVPVVIGFDIIKTKKWTSTLNAGLLPGIMLYSKGQTLSTKDINQYSKIKKSYHANFVLMIEAGLFLQYNISPNIGIFINPCYKQNLRLDYSNNSAGYSISFIGITGGVSIKL